MMMSTMEEAWRLLENIQTAFNSMLDKPAVDDETKLLLFTARRLMKSKLDKIRDAQRDTIDTLYDEPAPDSVLSTAEEKTYRFLDRSYGNFIRYQQFYAGLMDVVPFCSSTRDSLTMQLNSADSLGDAVMCDDPLTSESLSWDCFEDSLDCDDETHFHACDEMIWPMASSKAEKKLPLASTPVIKFRDFQTVVLGQHDDSVSNLESAIIATKKAVGSSHGETVCLNFGKTTRSHIDDLIKTGPPQAALAKMATKIQAALKEADRTYQLGILLPGCSQVFWPEWSLFQDLTEAKRVLIQARELKYGATTTFRFDAAVEGMKLKEVEIVQTIHFVDLPAEIRNMIYGHIMDQEGVRSTAGHIIRKQPAISRTCRSVNKEMLSLLFQRYGWMVCM